jgi:uncharacterized membrane protein YccC
LAAEDAAFEAKLAAEEAAFKAELEASEARFLAEEARRRAEFEAEMAAADARDSAADEDRARKEREFEALVKRTPKPALALWRWVVAGCEQFEGAMGGLPSSHRQAKAMTAPQLRAEAMSFYRGPPAGVHADTDKARTCLKTWLENELGRYREKEKKRKASIE